MNCSMRLAHVMSTTRIVSSKSDVQHLHDSCTQHENHRKQKSPRLNRPLHDHCVGNQRGTICRHKFVLFCFFWAQVNLDSLSIEDLIDETICNEDVVGFILQVKRRFRNQRSLIKEIEELQAK